MASILIRNVSDRTKDRLWLRAARNRRSMEAEARALLEAALIEKRTTPKNLAKSIATRFKDVGGVELQIAKREPMRDPPS